LATTYSGLLERLARNAEAAHDNDSAVRWWRVLNEADPLSSKNALGLMRAFMNAGDRAAALQHAERHERLVAQELGMSADPAVAELAAEIRARTERQPVAAPVLDPQSLVSEPERAAPPQNGATPVRPEPKAPVRRHLARYAIAALILVVLVATATAVRARMRGNRGATAGEASIAVLPLANVSRDQQDAAIVDGLTEELIAVLAKIPNLRVMARTSAFAFRNSDLGVRRIADSLGVTHILEGGVQRIGSRLRVQVRLVDGRDGSTRWAEIYDRDLRDVFAVESEIAGAVARELDLRLHGDLTQHVSRPPTRNIAAYELYLRGNDPALTRSDSGARLGLEYFRQAVALDPNYAAAYAGLARLQMRVSLSDTTSPQREHLALAERAALKAVALDDSLGEAHAALGLVRRSNFDMASAESELKRATALEPTTARFHEWLVQLYVVMERPAEAVAEGRRAVQLDPLSPTANAEFANALFANDRCDEALVQLSRLEALRPPLLRVRSIAARCYARRQMWPQAIAEARRNLPSGGSRAQALLGYMLARGGRTDEARQILAALLDRARRTNGGAYEVATVFAGLGDNDQAFTWLEKAIDERSVALDVSPIVLETLSADPRFDSLRRRMGLQNR
jgi:TolB-like protein/tetratricopeptide (TPR) repeat protein